MISGMPSLSVRALSARPTGIESVLDTYADRYWFYGSGKAALRDGLDPLVATGQNVLLPAYLPDAVAEPIADLDCEPRWYAITPSLAPDLADLEARIDGRTAAVMTVNYFGFPPPGLDDVADLAAAYDCYHIDDNAHSPLSVDDGTLLGTRGHFGITSLWKLFPLPNGAVLYVNDDTVADRFTPSGLATPNDRFAAGDYGFVLRSVLRDVLDTHVFIRRSVDALVGDEGDRTPRERYEASREPMSKLAARVLESADPEAIVAARRTNYRAWEPLLEGREDLSTPFPTLSPGICPQVRPVLADRPQRLRRELERLGVGGVHTWPRLPAAVRDDPAYGTANRLSRELLTLPVHQHVERERIERIGRELATY